MVSESIESLCQKARQAVAQGSYEQARQVYLQALGLRSDAPDVHYGLATVCFLLNDLPSAAYHFKEVTRLDPLRAGVWAARPASAWVRPCSALSQLGRSSRACR